MFLVFRYDRHSGVVKKYFRHCIVGKKSKMAAIYSNVLSEILMYCVMLKVYNPSN